MNAYLIQALSCTVIAVLSLLFTAPISAQSLHNSILPILKNIPVCSRNHPINVAMSTLKHSKDARTDVAVSYFTLGVRRYAEQAFNGENKNSETPSKLMPTIVAGFIDWIVGKTGWATSGTPLIRLASNAQLAKMFYGWDDKLNNDDLNGIHMHGLYSRKNRIIYLIDTWNPDNLFDRSLLLHELVHYLQMQNKVEADCTEQYEAQAYHLQIAWLREQGIQDPYKFLTLSELEIAVISECP